MRNQSQDTHGAAALQARLANVEQLLQTDPAAADAAAADILQEFPGNPMAGLFQGIARRLTGDAAGAVRALRPVCQNVPEAPLPHLQLGIALRESQDMAGAIQAVRRAVEAKVDFSDAWYVLADLLIESGDRQGADQAFAEYVQHSAQDPLLRQARDLLREDCIEDAERLLRSHVESHPVDVVALCMLADIAERYGNLPEAYVLLSDCVELAPSFTLARHNRAVVMLHQNMAEEALPEIDQLLAVDPSNPAVRKLRAAVLVRLLEHEESIGTCEALLDEDPNQPEVWTSLGHMLKSVGRRDECIAAYSKAIELRPSFGEPYWSMANLKIRKLPDAELASLERHLQMSELQPSDRINMHFAAGKALEDRQQFEESFQHYAEGNRLRLERKPYNYGELVDHIRRSKQLLSKEFFAERQGLGANAADPIFVLGLPRAGSTLVEQILASHSAVEGTMELPYIGAIAKSLDQWQRDSGTERYPEVLATLDQDTLCQLGEAYLDKTRPHRKLGRASFVDKMPNNYAHIGLIHLILPNARIIDVRRHPMACGFSLFKEHFAGAQNFSYSLETIGKYYRSYVALMAHWDDVLPGRVHRVTYESLVADTEHGIRRLLEYCGLPFEDTCVRFYENKRAVNTASAEQVREPINRKGIDHWRHFEPWLEPLKAELGPLPETYSKVE